MGVRFSSETIPDGSFLSSAEGMELKMLPKRGAGELPCKALAGAGLSLPPHGAPLFAGKFWIRIILLSMVSSEFAQSCLLLGRRPSSRRRSSGCRRGTSTATLLIATILERLRQVLAQHLAISQTEVYKNLRLHASAVSED